MKWISFNYKSGVTTAKAENAILSIIKVSPPEINWIFFEYVKLVRMKLQLGAGKYGKPYLSPNELQLPAVS